MTIALWVRRLQFSYSAEALRAELNEEHSYGEKKLGERGNGGEADLRDTWCEDRA